MVGSSTEFKVVSVVSYSAKSSPVFNAELDSEEAVDSILREFSKYTRRNNPVKRPAELETVSMHHAVTPGTRIRISLLRVSLFYFTYQRKRKGFVEKKRKCSEKL